MANDLARDAETSVLGAILIDGSPGLPASLSISPGDFCDPLHARLFSAMLDLSAKDEPIEEMTLRAAMPGNDGPRQGWAPYIATLSEHVATSANLQHYAKIMRAEARRRDALTVLHQGIANASKEGTDGDEVIAKLITQLGQLEAGRQLVKARSAKELVREEFKAIETRRDSDEIPGVPTCLAPIDNRLGGMMPGALVIIAARPSMGKSALACGIAKDLATRKGLGVLVFSCEMTGEEQIQRLIASEGSIDLHSIRTGRLANGDWPKLAKASSSLSIENLHFVDKSDLSINELRSMARAHASRHKVGLVVVDYLQLISGNGETREQEVASISRGLKALAMELRIPVIALSQLNRGLEQRADKRPMLSDLRESGSLEQDAHQVLFIYRDDYYRPDSDEPGIAEIGIAKNRNGPTGTAKLKWSGRYTRFDAITDELPRKPVPYSAAAARSDLD